MADCTSCKKERERLNHSPRKLTKLPIAVVKSNEFKNHKIPVNLCAHCDGAALEGAMHTHDERSRPATNDQ